ncbi:Mu-like prophage major head subunit gpT family protein [Pantoea sp. BAV 3049]|uniref:Mu-like prophage major head subunit gpT family protein n=1 Tax=Pantoea sp. BAV 3049 TaxID=2654188 RepID=UPI00131E81F4|nr:Mu-like prophage major head subunit gpT family protein [Pantoea sp. BAV 3049]
MDINTANLRLLFLNLKKSFQNGLKLSTPNWQRVATRIPSTGAANFYAWLEMFPKMREWIGEKQLTKLLEHDFVVPNRDFEATVVVKRNHIKDDQLGIYGIQASGAGDSATMWPDELVFELLDKAFTAKGYDGLPFISDKHKMGDTTYSNMGKAPLSVATQTEAKASFGAARTQMKKLKDRHNRPLNLRPDLLVVPPALEDVAKTLVTTDRLEDGKPNLYKGAAEVLVVQHLTSDTAWFLLDTTQVLKPLIYQDRETPTFVSQTTMDSDDVFMRAEYKYGVEGRGAAAFGYWQMAYGSTGAGA